MRECGTMIKASSSRTILPHSPPPHPLKGRHTRIGWWMVVAIDTCSSANDTFCDLCPRRPSDVAGGPDVS